VVARAVGCVIVIVRVPVHPAASVAVIVYVPGHKLLAELFGLVVVFGTAGDHVYV
jgi:hypothetical protein